MQSSRKKDKGKAKAAPRSDSDSDVEMIDPIPVVLDLTTPTPSPKRSRKDADPERIWAAEISDDMFALPKQPRLVPPVKGLAGTGSASPTPDTSARPAPASESSGQRPAAESSESHQEAAAQPRNTTSEAYHIRAPADIRTRDEAGLGEDIFWDIHSLDAIRISSGLIDTHLHSLLWFQDRLVEHHMNLVRTRNLAQKALDGIARAMFIRDRMDIMQDAAVAVQGGSS